MSASLIETFVWRTDLNNVKGKEVFILIWTLIIANLVNITTENRERSGGLANQTKFIVNTQ